MSIERVGDAHLPTDYGDFRIIAYRASDGNEHVAVVEGDPRGAAVLTRLHSECLTGDVLASRKCDCGDQLHHALRSIVAAGRGVVVYLRGHEGRGIGLANKIKAYELQDAGLDTVDANTAQGLPIDARRYDVAAEILADLGVRSVRLLSNNPAKAAGLVEYGIAVDELVPVVMSTHPDRAGYLRTKRQRLGHVGL